MIVITPQPHGYSKPEYGLAYELASAGAVLSGDIITEQAYVRLNYILAHQTELKRVASKHGLSGSELAHALFLSGVTFAKDPRDNQNLRENYRKATGIVPFPRDVLRHNDFSEAASNVAAFQESNRYS